MELVVNVLTRGTRAEERRGGRRSSPEADALEVPVVVPLGVFQVGLIADSR